jgi:hypothetical protein
MPKVTFINENRSVDVEAGRKISDVAAELGIAVCREEFTGTGLGNYTVWIKGPDGCVSPPSLWEKLSGIRGWRRLANKTRILGDVEVFTQAGLHDRLRAPRPVTAPPTPKTDPAARRLGVSAAGTAAFPGGNPQAVGKGAREAIARSTAKPKAAGAKGAAAATEAADDEEESDE